MTGTRRPSDAIELGRRRLSMRPLGVGVVFLGLAAFLLWVPTLFLGFLESQEADPRLLMTAVLIGALVLDAFAARAAIADPKLRVEGPEVAVEDSDVAFVVQLPALERPMRLDLPSPWARHSFVVDSPEPGVSSIPAPPRGVVDHLVVELFTTGPLALYSCTRRVRVWLPSPLHVGPRAWEHEVDLLHLRSTRFGLAERAVVGDELFRGARPYVRGDPRRRVHWKSTAHHGRLMVEETDGTGVVVVRVVLVADTPGPAAEAAISRVDWLAREGLRRGWIVELVTVEPMGQPPPPPPVDDALIGGVLVAQRSEQTVTVSAPVQAEHEVARRLAAAAFGRPEIARWTGPTRYVTAEGDRWE